MRYRAQQTAIGVSVTVHDDDKTAPHAPELTAARAGFELVRLEWTAPEGGGPVTGYELHVERVDDGSVVHDWDPAGTALGHTVAGLENGVEYRFRVRAVNRFGPGAPSDALTATPASLILTIVPRDGVDTIVEGEEARFDIVHSSPLTDWIELDVRYTYTGDMMLDPVSLVTTQYGPLSHPTRWLRTVATLDDAAIEPDGSVTLTLQPGDGYAIGEPSSATIRVLDNENGRVPGAPAAPTVSAVSRTALEATWDAPADRGSPGVIDGYDVQYRKVGEAYWLDGPLGVTDTQVVLERLETGTAYEVRVLARNIRNPRNLYIPVQENWSQPGTGSTAPAPVTVSVGQPSGSHQATEGDVLAFIVTSEPAPTWDMRVEVEVSESGAMLQEPRPTEVVIAAGTSEVSLEVATVDDTVHEAASEVVVSIVSRSDYNLRTAAVSRLVLDNDPDRAPGRPRNPHAEPVSDTELRLTWDWPLGIEQDEIASWVVSWSVEPCNVASPSWSASQTLPAGTDDPTAFTLSVGRTTAAHFRVAAIQAGAEAGPWSDAVCAKTEPPSLPRLSIANTSVQEESGAMLAFAVTLEHAAPGPVTVDWHTIDGTATAGEDYVRAEDTLTFATGETRKTIEVTVLDDNHDEGREMMVVYLSDPSGAQMGRRTAVGWIENADVIPQAWIARFGRTVADQVIDAVQDRVTAPRTEGAEVTLAGRRILDGKALHTESAESTLAGLHALDDAAVDAEAVEERELMAGSSFALTRGSEETGFGSLWGRGAVSRFDGRADELALNGEVSSAILGAEFARGRTIAGVAVSHSSSEGAYRGAKSGAVEASMTGIYPYVRHAPTERLSLWGVAGYGSGTLTVEPEGATAMENDLSMTMAAFGGRGVLASSPVGGGFELAAKADALLVRTSSEALQGSRASLAATKADVTRFRLGLEGSWQGLDRFEPRFEIGIRHDGGDADTGFGADVGGRLSWTDPSLGLQAEVRGRGLLTHEAGGFREHGFAGALTWDPAPASDHGPSLTLRHSLGAEASGGMDTLLGSKTPRKLGVENGNGLEARSFGATFGYGFAMLGGRLTASPELRLGWSEGARETAFGWRLKGAQSDAFELGVEASRVEAANDDTEHRIGVRLQVRF